jgi:hypothetical protein
MICVVMSSAKVSTLVSLSAAISAAVVAQDYVRVAPYYSQVCEMVPTEFAVGINRHLLAAIDINNAYRMAEFSQEADYAAALYASRYSVIYAAVCAADPSAVDRDIPIIDAQDIPIIQEEAIPVAYADTSAGEPGTLPVAKPVRNRVIPPSLPREVVMLDAVCSIFGF